jgi:DNA (cytosine-5)-methyltransferase 1
MMNKPRLLDLFCGGGGAARGYQQAGFYVIGVDIAPQPRYAGDEFIQADALTFPLDGYDAIHASPPCQAFTMMLNHGISSRDKHLNLIDITRKRLQATKKPYIIENVVGAPLEKAIILCGAMFGLRVYRHRWFESNILLFQPHHPKHTSKIAHAGNIPTPEQFYCPVGHLGDKSGSQRAMGIDWMHTQKEIANAIPPAYTHWIAQFLLDAVRIERAGVA